MSDFPELDDLDASEGDDNPIEASQSGGRFFLGRVAINLAGTIFADIWSEEEAPFLEASELNLQPLYTVLNVDPRSPEDIFLERQGVEDVLDFSPDDNTRGPYFGIDQFKAKLRGMRAAWHYITRIVRITGDVLEQYYLTIDAPKYVSQHGKRRKRAA
jgi:hypothetical protein